MLFFTLRIFDASLIINWTRAGSLPVFLAMYSAKGEGESFGKKYSLPSALEMIV